MIEVTRLFVVVVAAATTLALIAVWSPRGLWVKLGAVASSAVFLPVAYAGLVDLLSKPKPIDLEWWRGNVAEAEILGSRIQEGKGIFLYLQLPEGDEPRSYVLPWDRELAEQLQAAAREAERNRGGLRMRLPFEPSLDDREAKFYAPPQPSLPPKDEAPDAPPEYRRPGTDA